MSRRVSPTDAARAQREFRITPRRMLILRARLHRAEVWQAEAKAAVDALTKRAHDAELTLRASTKESAEDIVTVDRVHVARVRRMLDAWRDEYDLACVDTRRARTTLQNAQFAAGIAATQEAR